MMIRTFSIACLILTCLSFNEGKDVEIQGKVMVREPYCGGAEISPEEMSQISQPRPLPGKKLFVRKGNKNNINEPVVTTFCADAAGNFTLHLPPGEYCIVDTLKHNKKYIEQIARKYKKASTYYSAADKNCLKNWLSTPDAIFTVKEGAENKVEVIYHRPCDWNTVPCIYYDGPLPP